MKFISKRKEFRLVIRPTEVILDESRRPRIINGERVEFTNGVYFTEDVGLIAYLLHHKLYGLEFTSEIGNDPVRIKKATMTFDDGAELSGPQIVAGRFENTAKKKEHVIDMIRGANSTANSPIKKSVPKTEAWDTGTSNEASNMSRQEVENIIDNKLETFIGRIESMLNPVPKAVTTIVPVAAPILKEEPQKIEGIKTVRFSCPYCKEPFKSGFEVGTHKKTCSSKPA